MLPMNHLDDNANHIFIDTPYGPGYWVPKGDYVVNTVSRGAKNTGYNNFLKFMKPKARTVCDIGANIGEITWALSQFSQQVHAFEPTVNTFQLLKKNVEQNNLKNVSIYDKGVGAKHEIAHIALNGNTCGANARIQDVTKTKHQTEIMTIIPLDSLNLSDVDIIKIDVEGYELDVLQGAEQTILKDKPIIQLEVYEPALKRAKRDIADVYSWMLARDFIPYYVKFRKIVPESNEYIKVPKCIERFFIHKSILVPTEVPKNIRIISKI